MHGCNGRMGRAIMDMINKEEKLCLAAGIDAYGDELVETPFYRTIKDCKVEADVVIDFSSVLAVDDLLAYCVETNTACVLCTTGLSEAQEKLVKETTQKVAILQSANMSLGVNLLMKLLKDASKVLANAGFDIEIVEKHHNQKLDAPSGTALALADSINEEFNNEYEYIYDRSQVRQKRDGKELGISAVRGGTIVGEHDVIFAGEDEVLTFSHTAYSRGVFAKGAVEAAKFLASKEAGMYDMSDVIDQNTQN